MPNIVMLLSNAFRPDPRVEKEANSLARQGYSVTIVCWDRAAELPAETTLDSGVRVVRVQGIRTTYGAGIRQILHTPRFWSAAIRKALPLKPDLVHCHDLDTLFAGVRIKKLLGCKLIFDAHEDYPILMSQYLPKFVVPLLSFLEIQLLRHVDAVLAVSTVYIEKLKASGYLKTTHIPNVQNLEPFEKITDKQVTSLSQDLGLMPESSIVAYIGGFTRNRLILPLIEAMRSLPNVELLLCGDGHQRAAVEEAVQGMANVHYLGWIPIEQVPLYTCLSDVVYYCLKPDYPDSSPNALFNAMAAGKPVIVNKIGDLSRIVDKTGCGILLDDVTPHTIAQAIMKLHNTDLRHKLGEAGHRAAEREFNWRVVEKRLVDLYQDLLC